MLYKKDFFKLSTEEDNAYKKAKTYKENSYKKENNSYSLVDLMRYHELMPLSGYFFESLFPNNYLYSSYQFYGDQCYTIIDEFEKFIHNPKTKERDVLNFIKDREAYFILDGLFLNYDFGHHDSYLFREFPLPPNYVCDYLLVGKNSSGYEFVFIEFENPNGEIVLKDGSFGKEFRKGLDQVNAWDEWIDANFNTLRNVFAKYKKPETNLPEEFYVLDKTRIHFLVIAGKRDDFTDKTYRLKRMKSKNLKILHYDNLIDRARFNLDSKLSSKKTIGKV
jgi:hypothetical protein